MSRVERPFASLSGEQLRKAAKRAERDLADEIVRVRATDPKFADVLDRSMELDTEVELRRGPPSPRGRG